MTSEHAHAHATPTPELPPPPSPSADAGIAPPTDHPPAQNLRVPDAEEIDIFELKPLVALQLLCSSLELLVKVTGDIPPTPPVSRPQTPRLGEGTVEKDSTSQTEDKRHKRRSSQWTSNDTDLPTKARTPIGSPETRSSPHVEIVDADADLDWLPPQHNAVTRKFYSKKAPPISLEEYLMRLHRYCPMSTAVYLATSLYIHRLAVTDHLLPVTPRNVHRLVLAGLRVAMKALEDLSYPHSRFAKVGGVTELELGRLEISFCFVRDFNLRVTSEMLHDHAIAARSGLAVPMTLRPVLPTRDVGRMGAQQPEVAVATEPSAAAG